MTPFKRLHDEINYPITETLTPVKSQYVIKYSAWLILAKFNETIFKTVWWTKNKGILITVEYGDREDCKEAFDKELKKLKRSDESRNYHLPINP